MIPVRTRVQDQDSPRKMLRGIPAALRAAGQKVVEHWHRTMMPEHFTVSGGKRYGYKPRRGDLEPPYIVKRVYVNQHDKVGRVRRVSNPAYSWRKRREKGHNRPLVWSGASERAAKSDVRFSTRHVRKNDTIVAVAAMNLPKYFYAYRIDLDQPDKANELTRTLPQEQEELELMFMAQTEYELSRRMR